MSGFDVLLSLLFFILLIIILWRWLCGWHTSSSSTVQQEYIIPTPPLPSDISKYSVAPYGSLASNDQIECIICFDSFNQSDTIPLIRCGHIYHDVCLNKWLQKQNVCPLCKRVVVFNQGEHIV